MQLCSIKKKRRALCYGFVLAAVVQHVLGDNSDCFPLNVLAWRRAWKTEIRDAKALGLAVELATQRCMWPTWHELRVTFAEKRGKF